jgi:mannose-6-phosphate isomerase-like protein (cupin superfamily)
VAPDRDKDAPRILSLTPTESVEVRSSTPEALEVEATYGEASRPPPKHLHPDQDERFEVLAGSLRAVVGDEERTLGPGETLDIPRGTPHQMWNAGAGQARVAWQTRPRLRTEEWFTALDTLQRQGRVRHDGMPGPLAFGALLTEYRDVFRLAVGPEPVVRGALALLGAAGRVRGYRPVELGAGR